MKKTLRVAFYTLGCKLNFSETSAIARSFKSEGFERVDFEEHPDVFVINTCSVTDNADRKCKALVKKAKKISPESFVAIIGCYAQLKPEEIFLTEGVDIVLGANEKFNLPRYIKEIENNGKKILQACDITSVHEFSPSWSSGDRTRSFFKIQDGCDYSCSFCTIPLARGKSRSHSIFQTISSAKKLIEETKAREIVLTGVNTGDFGRLQGETFLNLIYELDQLEFDGRFRISSLEPNLLSDEIISFVAHSKHFVPHFHIPLQSGSNKILASMRRRYKKELYAQRVEKIKELMPECCIGVDVIVGYPGEGESEFIETYEFLRDLPISYLHVFPYSERPNTLAISMKDKVLSAEKERRSKMLHILSEKKKRIFYQSQIGKRMSVLWEAEKHEEFMFGFTSNYLKTRIAWDSKRVNTLSEVVIQGIDSDGIASVSEFAPSMIF